MSEILKSDDPRFLKQLALDIHRGDVFTNLNIPADQAKMMTAKVFMLLGLGGFPKEVDPKTVGLIYEYVSAAAPLSISGMPMFYSFRYLTIENTNKVIKYIQVLRQQEQDLMNMEEPCVINISTDSPET